MKIIEAEDLIPEGPTKEEIIQMAIDRMTIEDIEKAIRGTLVYKGVVVSGDSNDEREEMRRLWVQVSNRQRPNQGLP